MTSTKIKNYVLKITMRRFSPPNWCKVLVSGAMRFDELHELIQDMFGFEGMHLHQFWVGDFTYSSMTNYFGRSMDWDDMEDEAKLTVQKVFGTWRFSKIRYEYDFGDGWEFDIVCQKIADEAPEDGNSQLLKRKGPNAIEDCGGPWGLMDLYYIREHYDEIPPEKRSCLGWAWPDEFDEEGNRLPEEGENSEQDAKKSTKKSVSKKK